MGALDQIAPHREPGFRKCGRFDQAQSGRHGQGAACRHTTKFGVTAAGGQCSDGITDLPLVDIGTHSNYFSCDLQSKDRGCVRRRWVSSLTLKDIGAIHARGCYLYQKFVTARLGDIAIAEHHAFRIAAGTMQNRFHKVSVARSCGAEADD